MIRRYRQGIEARAERRAGARDLRRKKSYEMEKE
jgi:hypothetical protein